MSNTDYFQNFKYDDVKTINANIGKKYSFAVEVYKDIIAAEGGKTNNADAKAINLDKIKNSFCLPQPPASMDFTQVVTKEKKSYFVLVDCKFNVKFSSLKSITKKSIQDKVCFSKKLLSVNNETFVPYPMYFFLFSDEKFSQIRNTWSRKLNNDPNYIAICKSEYEVIF